MKIKCIVKKIASNKNYPKCSDLKRCLFKISKFTKNVKYSRIKSKCFCYYISGAVILVKEQVIVL